MSGTLSCWRRAIGGRSPCLVYCTANEEWGVSQTDGEPPADLVTAILLQFGD